MRITKNKSILKKRVYLFLLVILFLLFFLLFLNTKTIKQNSNERVVVFVLDGGDWRIINKLLNDDKLENIKHMINNGASGKFLNVQPLYTPPNMASLFSGKLPYKHGILSHFEFTAGDTKNQLYRNMEVKPIWKILANKNITIDLVGFQEFDYAPKIDGTIVTGLYIIKQVAKHNNYLLNVSNELNFLRFVPDSILISRSTDNILKDYGFLDSSESIMLKNNLSPDFDTEITHAIVPYIINSLKITEKSKKGNFEFSKLVKGLEIFFDSTISAKFVFEYDMLSKEIALDLFKKHKSNILFIYFSGTDVFGHNYYFEGWHLEDKNNEQEQLYRYYEIIDSYIGEFLNSSDENITFFIISDHGIQNMTISQYIEEIQYHTQNGIFISYGKNIKKGQKIENAAIVDILPTLLYIYNQPFAEDFDGKILLDIFNEVYTRNKVIKIIPTYED